MEPQGYTTRFPPGLGSRNVERLLAHIIITEMEKEQMRDWESGVMDIMDRQAWEESIFSKQSWELWELEPGFVPASMQRYCSMTDEEMTRLESAETEDICRCVMEMQSLARKDSRLDPAVQFFRMAMMQCIRHKYTVQRFAITLKNAVVFFASSACGAEGPRQTLIRRRVDDMITTYNKFKNTIRVFFAWQRYELRKEQGIFITANGGSVELPMDRHSTLAQDGHLPFHGDFYPPVNVSSGSISHYGSNDTSDGYFVSSSSSGSSGSPCSAHWHGSVHSGSGQTATTFSFHPTANSISNKCSNKSSNISGLSGFPGSLPAAYRHNNVAGVSGQSFNDLNAPRYSSAVNGNSYGHSNEGFPAAMNGNHKGDKNKSMMRTSPGC